MNNLKRRELTEKRSANTKVFENENHTFTAEIYPIKVHYKKGDKWEEIDNHLALADVSRTRGSVNEDINSRWENFNNDLKVKFEKRAKDGKTVRISKDNCKIVWGLENPNNVEAEVKSTELWENIGVSQSVSKIVYPAVYDNVNLEYLLIGDKIKENLVLSVPERDKFHFFYQVDNLTAEDHGGVIVFLDENGKEIFVLSAPYMEDHTGARCENVRLELHQEDNEKCYVISLKLDTKWLNDPNRIYPVTVDPVIITSQDINDIKDSYVDSTDCNKNYYRIEKLKTLGGKRIQRSFIKFALPEIKSADMIIDAQFNMVSLKRNDYTERSIQVHKVMQYWESEKITWNNKPMYDTQVIDLCKYKGDVIKNLSFNITNLVKDWYLNDNNYGLMVRDSEEVNYDDEGVFMSSDSVSDFTELRPSIRITYVNYSGLEPYWTYHSKSIGRAGTSYVNDYNGNLVLLNPLAALNGCRMPISLELVYNSNDRNTNIGYGYGNRTNYNQTIEKVTISKVDYYKHIDRDGTVHYFYYDQTNKVWKDESNEEYELTIGSTDTEAFTIKDKDDAKLIFNRKGLLSKIEDKNGNFAALSYSGTKITEVVNPSGQKIILHYNVEGLLDSITVPSGKKKTFTYTNTCLTGIIFPDGEKVTYTYNGRHMLTSAVNFDDYRLDYAYYTSSPYRIKQVTEYAGNTLGSHMKISFGYNKTKFMDENGDYEIYQFNNSGNTICIQDKYGYALSQKFNTKGNIADQVSNEAKMQYSTVQLLRDPLAQKSGVWKSASTDATVVPGVDTDINNVKLGSKSLRLESTDITGYGRWYQSVLLKAGQTVTFSAYIKGTLTERASNGSVYLRLTYIDNNGNAVSTYSERITTNQSSWTLYKVTTTLPDDLQNTNVSANFMMYKVNGIFYADDMQLEEGAVNNRHNLVENGDFLNNKLTSFKKDHSDDGDRLIAIGDTTETPISGHAIVTAASAKVYSGPGTSYPVRLTMENSDYLCVHSYVLGENGKRWYYMHAEGKRYGYVNGSNIRVYMGGSNSMRGGFVSQDGLGLRKSPISTSALVYGNIALNTPLVLVTTKKDSDGNTWYFCAINANGNCYQGYLPMNWVTRACANYVTGKLIKETQAYIEPSDTLTVTKKIAAGKEVEVRGVLTKENGDKWYYVCEKNSVPLYYIKSENVNLNTTPIISAIENEKFTERIGGLNEYIYKIVGDPWQDKKLTQTIELPGKKGDTFMVNAWGRGNPLPESTEYKDRHFGVEVVFISDKNAREIHKTSFGADVEEWQFLSDVYVTNAPYAKIEVSYVYSQNSNVAYFDGISLFKESFGQSYTYDEKGNIISVAEEDKKERKFEYNEKNDLVSFTDAKGKKFKYEYDSKHNVTKGTSAANLVYLLSYNKFGNITQQRLADPNNSTSFITEKCTYTTSGNYPSSFTDALGNKITYHWDETKGILKSAVDARGNTVTYTYDENDRLTKTSQGVTDLEGQNLTVSDEYTYMYDILSQIRHNGFTYRFVYDPFEKLKEYYIAEHKCVSFDYEAKNGKMTRMIYGNGDSIRYVYDSYGRVAEIYYKASKSAEEVKYIENIYNKYSDLCSVKHLGSGKRYDMEYDLSGRLMRVIDESGNSYRYTYNAENEMTKMVRKVGTSTVTEAFTYDDDGKELTFSVHGKKRTTTYDGFGRVTKHTWNTTTPLNYTYGYAVNGDNHSNLITSVKVGTDTISCKYDSCGNIISITDSDGTSTFSYDEKNRLFRENNHQTGKTVTYLYDAGDNLVASNEYSFTLSDTIVENPISTDSYLYADDWKDQLISVNDKNITYDSIGNMLSYNGNTYSWTIGKRLAAVEDMNGKVTYDYDHAGNRIRKTIGVTATNYQYAGAMLTSETVGNRKIWYNYDSNGAIVSMIYGGKDYFYLKNIQGDIIGLADENGTQVVQYKYDSWGKIISITGTLASTVGVDNPIRYRGYYYDFETGMYYLAKRYYSPELRRFINADVMQVLGDTTAEAKKKNLYCYCDGNPVSCVDIDGEFAIPIGAVVTAIGGVLGAATNCISAIRQHKSAGEVLSSTARGFIGGCLEGALSLIGGGMIARTAIGAAGSVVSGVISGTVHDVQDVVKTVAIGSLSGIIGDVAEAGMLRYDTYLMKKRFLAKGATSNKVTKSIIKNYHFIWKDTTETGIKKFSRELYSNTKELVAKRQIRYATHINSKGTSSLVSLVANDATGPRYVKVYAHVGPNSSYQQYFWKEI